MSRSQESGARGRFLEDCVYLSGTVFYSDLRDF